MKLNTYEICTIILAALTFPTFVTSAPPTNPNSPKVKHDWAIKLYENQQCTGKSAEFAGMGSSGCRRNIPNGGTKGFFKGHIDSTSSVNLYGDDHCGHGYKVDAIHSNIDDKCKKIRGKKKHIKSFDITCS
ncbi:uncharacterized protein N7458_008849 [Penicillium daleae]|uniref:Secreted protein n=1 Tax=Penicillium daleae TaxID=63821 RepID=A0AAD6BVV3_9EURO|nr:uncharacterized protein N7458_008849 [Penicillium daleae]KAJ5437851.1 hypothetical protein N7458_008849 [Penicillium daleae]